MHRLQELVRLYRLGEDARSIARRLRMSPNTEREYRNALKRSGLLHGDAESLPDLAVLRLAIEACKPTRPPPRHESSVERWREHVERFVTAGGTPKAIFDRLRVEHEGVRPGDRTWAQTSSRGGHGSGRQRALAAVAT